MTFAEYRFLTVEDALELHEMQLEQYGGATGIRDRGLLESAVMIQRFLIHKKFGFLIRMDPLPAVILAAQSFSKEIMSTSFMG